MMSGLPPLREVIARYRLSADKSFGQHFLLDPNITDRIARAAGPLDGVNVLEIGPGPGGLTRSLLSAGASRVTVIEMDERFSAALEDIKAASDGRLDIIMGNGLKINPAEHNITRIAANLPYNVGTKMLVNWLTVNPIFWDRLVLMFQKEVALRIIAKPGDKAYGRLAILTGSVASAHMIMEVPAKCFTPPPKVDSAVISLEPLPEGERYSDLKTLSRVTQCAFGMRRKMLRRSLRPLAKTAGIEVEAWLEACEVDPQRRPETLEIKQFQALANVVAGKI
ncbi:MAG: 16S rRNA (adenine(1518)-N(6)/adenine(1519)-N(6))-dimethyltransferase RsmA [Robiginitomaculum sp.]